MAQVVISTDLELAAQDALEPKISKVALALALWLPLCCSVPDGPDLCCSKPWSSTGASTTAHTSPT